MEFRMSLKTAADVINALTTAAHVHDRNAEVARSTFRRDEYAKAARTCRALADQFQCGAESYGGPADAPYPITEISK